ncbi:MAG: UvrD-helicase domain-containing protein [Bacteroidales bacterium]|nr:UvrD-helicase domain-containing protein [Bacteroidales bacterium]
MVKILKASAGSGKTFHLAKTYIRLLLQDPNPLAYRHILAVTFTNKATDEMKRRILKELHRLSTDPGKSKYTRDFVPSVFPSEDSLKEKAGVILMGILHDYGAFAVSTIDRFFQQTLKAFSREIGQFASYQVELDKDALVTESVDRILDSITEEDKALLGWLSESMMEQLEQGKKPDLEKGLTQMAKRLKSDEHRSLLEKYGIDEESAYSKENLSWMKKRFRQVNASFAGMVKASVKEVEDAFEGCGVSPFDTSGHFLSKVLDKLAAMDGRSEAPELTVSFRVRAADFGSWFTKANQPRYAHLENVLAPPVARMVGVYDKGIKTYNTARALLGQINSLGIASDLSKAFQDLLKDKNVLSLDDSNMILKGIIDGSDAPFIYEKLGVRYEHFLLDEFQDTSRVQWENFKPLIANSNAGGFENLLVGDIKQSIYRWRGSDWKLMAKDVGEQFPLAVSDSLEGNWRSLGNIVEFNNRFFTHAAGELDRLYGGNAPIPVSSIYGTDGEGQKVMVKEEAGGSVEAVFCPADGQDSFILEAVRRVLGSGARPGDITILVRKRDDGASVSKFLMENGIDVISDDSLSLKSSLIVRKLVSLVSSVKNPGDTIGSYLAKQAGVDAGGLVYHSLPDLCEQLVRILQKIEDPDVFKSETLYIQAFMDHVQDHAAVYGSSLDLFLKDWEEDDTRISSSADADAVRVMTIHKAKGLEFPYVIFPYSEKVELFRSENAWTVPKVEGTPLEEMGKVAFDVQLSSKSSETLFEDAYKEELLLQYIDNINTYYVALTRASKGITIISDSAAKAKSCFAGILHEYLKNEGTAYGFEKETDESEGVTIFRKGSLYDFNRLERKESVILKREPGYPSFPLNPESEDDSSERGRLRISSESADFFTEEGMANARARQNGTVLHDILSRVVVPSDLGESVLKAVRDGSLEAGRADEVTGMLSDRISRHPEWFPIEGAEILNETALIDYDGREWRPDRVIVKGGSVTVVDYKFGEHNPRYRTQVARYASIYRRLGFKDVSTAIWYVPSDEVE